MVPREQQQHLSELARFAETQIWWIRNSGVAFQQSVFSRLWCLCNVWTWRGWSNFPAYSFLSVISESHNRDYCTRCGRWTSTSSCFVAHTSCHWPTGSPIDLRQLTGFKTAFTSLDHVSTSPALGKLCVCLVPTPLWWKATRINMGFNLLMTPWLYLGTQFLFSPTLHTTLFWSPVCRLQASISNQLRQFIRSHSCARNLNYNLK